MAHFLVTPGGKWKASVIITGAARADIDRFCANHLDGRYEVVTDDSLGRDKVRQAVLLANEADRFKLREAYDVVEMLFNF